MRIFYALLIEGYDNFSHIAIKLWKVELSFPICMEGFTSSGLNTMDELGDLYYGKKC